MCVRQLNGTAGPQITQWRIERAQHAWSSSLVKIPCMLDLIINEREPDPVQTVSCTNQMAADAIRLNYPMNSNSK